MSTEIISKTNTLSEDHWESFGTDDLVARPFADLGKVRHIRFSALGTTWTLAVANNFESVCLAERFAAASQVMLAEIARDDLCLVPTRINIHVEEKVEHPNDTVEYIESLPINDGRNWGRATNTH